MTWHNPLAAPELQLPGESTIFTWRQMKSSDKMWRESVRLAWEISPMLAIYLPTRLKSSEKSVVGEEVSRLVRINPDEVIHHAEALTYLVTSDVVLNDCPEVKKIFIGCKLSLSANFMCVNVGKLTCYLYAYRTNNM